jgi:hypothetical protein
MALRNLDTAPPAEAAAITRACVDHGIPATRTLDEAAVAVAAAQRWAGRRPQPARRHRRDRRAGGGRGR